MHINHRQSNWYVLFVFMILSISIVAIAVTVGQTFTQEQLDGFTENQIRNNIDSKRVKVTIENNKIIFDYNFDVPIKLEDGTYEIVRTHPFYDIPLNTYKKCKAENDNDSTYCKETLIVPELERYEKSIENSKVEEVLKWQTPDDEVTEEEFYDLLD